MENKCIANYSTTYVLTFVTDNVILKAIQSGHLEILKVILQSRQDVEKNPVIFVSSTGSEWTILHIAASYGHVNILQYYKDDLGYENINPLDNLGEWTPLRYAAKGGKLDVVKYFIDNGHKTTGKIHLF